MTQPTQIFATTGQFNSKVRSGYGHYDVSVTIYTNDESINYTLTTTNVSLIDDLSDDDNDVVESAKQSLIDDAIQSYGVEKSEYFTYIY